MVQFSFSAGFLSIMGREGDPEIDTQNWRGEEKKLNVLGGEKMNIISSHTNNPKGREKK